MPQEELGHKGQDRMSFSIFAAKLIHVFQFLASQLLESLAGCRLGSKGKKGCNKGCTVGGAVLEEISTQSTSCLCSSTQLVPASTATEFPMAPAPMMMASNDLARVATANRRFADGTIPGLVQDL